MPTRRAALPFTRRSAGRDINPTLSIGALSIVTRPTFPFAALLMCCLMMAGLHPAGAVPSPVGTDHPAIASEASRAPQRLAQTQPAPATAAAPSPAPAAADEPVGNVATLTGTATVIRNKDSIALKLQDDIFMNDVLQTSANSTLGVTFNDATTFNLTANAKITVDNYVYEDGGKQNAALFDVARGTVAFVAAAVAHTGDMKISTPTATLGIRGTTGLVEVPEGAVAAGANHVNIKLYPDPDGRVGRIEVNDRTGARLGSLTQGASGFTIRPGAMGRFTASPLAISPQQALRDQGIVRQVHAAQSVGRQIVTQKRIERQQNPNRNNPRATPPRPPGPQRPNGLPPRPGSPQQPGSPNRQGLQNQPGQPNRPGQPNQLAKPGQPGQPKQLAKPTEPGQPQPQQRPNLQPQPNGPGLQRQGLQNRPVLQPRRPALPAPKAKPRKEKR
jgi:hypothetical protein